MASLLEVSGAYHRGRSCGERFCARRRDRDDRGAPHERGHADRTADSGRSRRRSWCRVSTLWTPRASAS